jgi:hypothetical protein
VSPITSGPYGFVLSWIGWWTDPGYAGARVWDNGRRKKELTALLRKSAKLRKVSNELAAEAQRLRGEIATSTRGRVGDRRKKARIKGK